MASVEVDYLNFVKAFFNDKYQRKGQNKKKKVFLGRDPAVFCSIDQAKAKKKSIIMVLTRSDGARP